MGVTLVARIFPPIVEEVSSNEIITSKKEAIDVYTGRREWILNDDVESNLSFFYTFQGEVWLDVSWLGAEEVLNDLKSRNERLVEKVLNSFVGVVPKILFKKVNGKYHFVWNPPRRQKEVILPTRGLTVVSTGTTTYRPLEEVEVTVKIDLLIKEKEMWSLWNGGIFLEDSRAEVLSQLFKEWLVETCGVKRGKGNDEKVLTSWAVGLIPPAFHFLVLDMFTVDGLDMPEWAVKEIVNFWESLDRKWKKKTKVGSSATIKKSNPFWEKVHQITKSILFSVLLLNRGDTWRSPFTLPLTDREQGILSKTLFDENTQFEEFKFYLRP